MQLTFAHKDLEQAIVRSGIHQEKASETDCSPGHV